MPGYFASLVDPDQPRSFFGVPLAADSWTPLDFSDAPPPAARPDAAPSEPLTYPGGSPVIDPLTDQPYPRPERLDINKNLAFGEWLRRGTEHPAEGLAIPSVTFGALFPAGSVMDYQRPFGHLSPFDKKMTSVTAYNFGATGAAAGYDLERLLWGAGLYNRTLGDTKDAKPPFGLTDDRTKHRSRL